MTNNHVPCTLPQGIAFHAEGEANFYRLMRTGNWLARVQFNGELLVWDQEQLLNAMLQGQQAAPVGEHGDAYQGAREDLAIWKRRALEAEARVRQQDQIIDQMGEDLNAINGPTFMGEPVLPSERQSGVVVPYDLLIRVLEPVTSEQYINSKHELLALMFEFARLNGAGSHE